MAKKQASPSDMFMNFAGVEARTDAADSSSVEETRLNTGLSIRGMLIWLIHLVEWWPHILTTNILNVRMALSTRQGLTTFPNMTDDGVICVQESRLVGAVAAGLAENAMPTRSSYLPPVPIAAPTLSVYLTSDTNHANGLDKLAPVRIGFTTAGLDAAAYTEIAETWGW